MDNLNIFTQLEMPINEIVGCSKKACKTFNGLN